MTVHPRQRPDGVHTIPQGPLTKAEHISLLKLAIGANLAARVDHDRRQEAASRGRPCEIKVYSAADLLGADDNRLYLGQKGVAQAAERAGAAPVQRARHD
jgi:hypothetical protein